MLRRASPTVDESPPAQPALCCVPRPPHHDPSSRRPGESGRRGHVQRADSEPRRHPAVAQCTRRKRLYQYNFLKRSERARAQSSPSPARSEQSRNSRVFQKACKRETEHLRKRWTALVSERSGCFVVPGVAMTAGCGGVPLAPPRAPPGSCPRRAPQVSCWFLRRTVAGSIWWRGSLNSESSTLHHDTAAPTGERRGWVGARVTRQPGTTGF